MGAKGTMLILLGIAGALCLLAPGSEAADPVSVLSILKASKEAIESYDVERNMEIVHKHYFTTTKEQSVWYHAVKTTEDSFGMGLGLQDLEFIERIIQKMASHIQSCSILNGVVKADCISRTGDIMLDLEHGLLWPFETGVGPDSQRAKWGFLFNTAAYLSAHVTIMAMDAMSKGYNNNKYLMKPKVIPFRDALHKHTMFAISDQGEWSVTMKEWRREQIGPASLCDMKEYLWQSFQQVCETRWHSSEWVVTGPNDEFTGVKRSNPANATTTTTTETAQESPAGKRSGTVDGEEDIGDFDALTWTEAETLGQLSQFGGVDNYKRRMYRVQIYDNVKRKVIYEEFKDADPSSRGVTLDKLAIEALKFREKAVDEEVSKISDLVVAFDARQSVIKVSELIGKKMEQM